MVIKGLGASITSNAGHKSPSFGIDTRNLILSITCTIGEAEASFEKHRLKDELNQAGRATDDLLQLR